MLSLVHCQHSGCLRETESVLCRPVDPSSPSGVQYSWGIRLRWGLSSDKGGFKTLLQTPNSSVGSWAARGRDIHIINSNRTGLLWLFSRPFYWLVQRFPKVCPDFGPSVFGVVGGVVWGFQSLLACCFWLWVDTIFTLSPGVWFRYEHILCVLWQQRGRESSYWTIFPQVKS